LVFVKQRRHVADAVNCVSEYDSIPCKLAGELGTIEVEVNVAVSWAWTSIIPAMLAVPKRAATTNGFLEKNFIGYFFIFLQRKILAPKDCAPVLVAA
jgi:hypothetical protein